MRAVLVLGLAVLAAAWASVDARAASRLRIVDLQTGAITAQADGRSWSHLTWRADGTLAATASGRSVRVLPSGSLATVRGAFSTALSPAGDRLAAVLSAGRRDERVEVRTLSGAVLGSRRFRGSDLGLAWRRDGGQLAVSWSDRHDGHRITILDARGTPVRTFRVPAVASFTDAGWAPDGKTLTFVSEPPNPLTEPAPREIRRLDLATGAQTVLLRATRCDATPVGLCELLEAPAVAPDGMRVAVVRDLNAVTLLAPAALPAHVTPAPQCDGVFDVAWAPDGASILVAYVEGDKMRLAQLSTTPFGGSPRVVADLGHTDVNNLTISPDGTRAAFSGTSDIDF